MALTANCDVGSQFAVERGSGPRVARQKTAKTPRHLGPAKLRRIAQDGSSSPGKCPVLTAFLRLIQNGFLRPRFRTPGTRESSHDSRLKLSWPARRPAPPRI